MRDIEAGRLSAGSFSGMSSAECNHFFMVRDSSATEDTIVMTDGKTLLLEIRATTVTTTSIRLFSRSTKE